jgi:hypothetical protein
MLLTHIVFLQLFQHSSRTPSSFLHFWDQVKQLSQCALTFRYFYFVLLGFSRVMVYLSRQNTVLIWPLDQVFFFCSVIRKIIPLPFHHYVPSRSLRPSLQLSSYAILFSKVNLEAEEPLSITDQCTILSECLKTQKKKKKQITKYDTRYRCLGLSFFQGITTYFISYRPAALSLHDGNLPSTPCHSPPSVLIDSHGHHFARNYIFCQVIFAPIDSYLLFYLSSYPNHLIELLHLLLMLTFDRVIWPIKSITTASKQSIRFSTYSPLSLADLKVIVTRLLARKINQIVFLFVVAKVSPYRYYQPSW